MSRSQLIAVDLGASSGRVISGTLDRGRLTTRELARFPNAPVLLPAVPGTLSTVVRPTLHWDVLRLWGGILDGLRAAQRATADDGPVASVGVDTWGVDYGLLDSGGVLLGNPTHYRDPRTEGIPEEFLAAVGPQASYSRTGAQVQAFNTVFQLAAEARCGRWATRAPEPGDLLLLMPDLLSGWLSGARITEATNASTTGLLDPATRQWDPSAVSGLAAYAGVDVTTLLAPLVEPGTVVGPLRSGAVLGVDADGPTGLDSAQVVAVGSHDTASAVAAVPMSRPDAAYISSGTWSLVGLELDAPVRTEAARAANFTNELGVGGTVRFLRNVAGLWLLQESLRTWAARGSAVDLPALLRGAADVAPLRCVLDVDAAAFTAPGDMPARIADAARATGQPAPASAPETVRVICDSLALAYRRAVRTAAELTGRAITEVHIVGGGARNALLCQLTGDATGLPVVAGPAEGTAIGNLLVQAGALGQLPDGLPAIREVVAASCDLVRYEPTGNDHAWDRAEHRLRASA